jgi:hypothetical protein
MARGGKREGAGRPSGSVSAVTQAQKEAALEGGESPLDYMLRVMRDATADLGRRDDMAKAAAPYAHAKLASVDANVKANVDGSITFTWQPPQ